LGIKPLFIPWLTFNNYSASPLIRLLNGNPAGLLTQPDLMTSDPFMNVPVFFRIKLLFFLWILGASLFVIHLILLWNRNRTLYQNCYPVRCQVLEKLYAETCNQLKIHRAPRLLWSDAVTSPVLQGLIHPKIILYATVFSQYKADETKLILAHELAYYRRGDLVWNWIPVIARIVFFFNPLVWLAVRGWKTRQEIGCDHIAVHYTGARSVDYGKVLVKATVQPKDYSKFGWASMGIHQFFVSGSKQTLFKRLKALDNPSRNKLKWRWLSISLTALFGITVLLPWQLPHTIFFSVKYNAYIEPGQKIYPLNNLTIFGNIPKTEKIRIRNFKVVINNQKITDGITFNTYGKYSAYNFEGYLLLNDSFDLKQPHQIKVFVDTTTGYFQTIYVVDFREKNLWANHSL